MGLSRPLLPVLRRPVIPVTRFDLQKDEYSSCIGCCQGGRDISSPCTQRTIWIKFILPTVKQMWLFWLPPLYYWTISGQLNAAFDRLFAVAECDANCRNPHKESVLLMAAGVMALMSKMWLEGLIKHLGWRDLGQFFNRRR